MRVSIDRDIMDTQMNLDPAVAMRVSIDRDIMDTQMNLNFLNLEVRMWNLEFLGLYCIPIRNEFKS
jgi:hypothetical protein